MDFHETIKEALLDTLESNFPFVHIHSSHIDDEIDALSEQMWKTFDSLIGEIVEEYTTTVSHIETHQYAPELNKIWMSNGVSIPAPGIRSISEAEKLLKDK